METKQSDTQSSCRIRTHRKWADRLVRGRFPGWMWSLSTSSTDARADECRAQRRRRTNGDDSPSRTARVVAAEGGCCRVALQHGEELREALEARNAVTVCGWMDGTCLRRVRAEVDRRHQGAIFEAVELKQEGGVPPGPPSLPRVDTAGAERCSVEEKGAADTAAERLQGMTDGISLSGLSSLPRTVHRMQSLRWQDSNCARQERKPTAIW